MKAAEEADAAAELLQQAEMAVQAMLRADDGAGDPAWHQYIVILPPMCLCLATLNI
jgi:hypothetical protein